jgi:hypothetical protein
MSGHLLAAIIMFAITVGFTALFWLPAIKFKQKNHIVNFYWVGLWGFLSSITALSGAQAILIILRQDVQVFTNAFLTGVSAAFVIFVMFAWARLTLLGVSTAVKKAAKA